MTAAVLLIFGRLCFAGAAVYFFTHFLFGGPPQLLGIGIVLAVATLLLLASAFLIRDFGWLWQMPVIGIAVAGLAIGAAMLKLYFARQPHLLDSFESGVTVVSLAAFAGSVALLRRCRKR
jgi:hypothetical protein